MMFLYLNQRTQFKLHLCHPISIVEEKRLDASAGTFVSKKLELSRLLGQDGLQFLLSPVSLDVITWTYFTVSSYLSGFHGSDARW